MAGGKALRKYLNELDQKAATDRLLRVGFLGDSMHTAKNANGKIVPTAQVAAWNEWGNPEGNGGPKRPPRPFFRSMVQEKKGTWGNSLAKLLKNNGGDMEKALALMGEGIKGQLQHSINEFSDPPLADATVKAKGFSKPLIDTAEMLRAVDYQVLEGTDAVELSGGEEGGAQI